MRSIQKVDLVDLGMEVGLVIYLVAMVTATVISLEVLVATVVIRSVSIYAHYVDM